MAFRVRRMAQPNFSDLAESNGVPHAQVGEGWVDLPQKGLGNSPGLFCGGQPYPRRLGRVAHRWTRLGLKSWAEPSGGL